MLGQDIRDKTKELEELRRGWIHGKGANCYAFVNYDGSGIYIMQNTMVGGGMKLGVRGKKKGERKKEENYIKKGKRP